MDIHKDSGLQFSLPGSASGFDIMVLLAPTEGVRKCPSSFFWVCLGRIGVNCWC